MRTFRKLFELLSPKQKRKAFVLLILMMAGMVVEMLGVGLVLPTLSVLTQNDWAASHLPEGAAAILSSNQSRSKVVIGAAAFLVTIYFFKAAFLSYLANAQMRFAFQVQEDVSYRLFLSYMKQPYAFHLNHNSSRLMQNVIQEVSLLVGAITSSMIVFSEALVLIGIAGLLIAVEPIGVISVGLALSVVVGGFYGSTRAYIRALGQARLHHEGLRVQHVQQGLGGIKDIKILGCEEQFLRAFRLHNEESARVSASQATLQLLPRPWLEMLAVGALAIFSILIVMRSGTANLIPTLGVFAAAAFRLLPSVNRILASSQAIRFALPVVEILHLELTHAVVHDNPVVAKDEIRLSVSIELKDVQFTYPGASRPTLSDVNLSIQRGEMLGIIGASGAGKSTLVDIILGLLQPNTGTVQVDGKSIVRNLRGWQNHVGYVPQSVYLADDTLRNNIAFGIAESHIDELALARAIRDSQLEVFVGGLPDGLNTTVGERGVRLSGGQRQRIGIARALYRDPDVLLLDEATSALDNQTEADVMHTVIKLREKKTIIVVSHRHTTVERCDRIVKVAHGNTVQVSTNLSQGKIDIGMGDD